MLIQPLLTPNVRAITPAVAAPQRDRAPEVLAAGTPRKLRDKLVALLGADRVLARPIDLVRYATDASPYRLFPKVIVVAQSATVEEAAEVRAGDFAAYLGSNRTCELGLNLATGKNYESFMFVLEELSRTTQVGRA